MPTVVCEKHRLRYDSETQTGCVLCRKEAGAAAGATVPNEVPAAAASRPAPGSPAPASSKPQSPAAPPPAATGVAGPLAVAASIWLVSSVVLYTAHHQIAAAYASDPADEEAAMLAEEESAEGGAAMPRSGTAIGQTEAVLEEIRNLQDEPAAHQTGAPPAIPSSEQLSLSQEPVDEEHSSTEPVEIETSGSDGGGRAPARQP